MKANGKPTPRRPIEREYLATLNAAVPLDTWQAICKRAADDALAGDAKARLVGPTPICGPRWKRLSAAPALNPGPACGIRCGQVAKRTWPDNFRWRL